MFLKVRGIANGDEASIYSPALPVTLSKQDCQVSENSEWLSFSPVRMKFILFKASSVMHLKCHLDQFSDFLQITFMICTQGQLLDISCVALSTILWLKPMLGMLSYFRTLMAMFDKSEVITLNCVFQMVHPGNALRFIFPSILLIHFYCFLCSCTSPCICMGILMALCVCRW